MKHPSLFDDPLQKIISIDLSQTSRLSPDDQNFCDDLEKDKNKIIGTINHILGDARKHLFSIQNVFVCTEFIGRIENKRDELLHNFINRVTRYFTDKYNVTIDPALIAKNTLNQEKRHYHYSEYEYTVVDKDEKKGIDVSMEKILDEIFIQLGGFTFQEKSEKEITDACKKAFMPYGKEPRISIIKDKLTAYGFLSLEHQYSGGYRISHYGSRDAHTLFSALSHFETNDGSILEAFKPYLDYNTSIDFLSKNEFELEKIKAIKCYKNRKGEMWFKDNGTACEFARKYMGHQA